MKYTKLNNMIIYDVIIIIKIFILRLVKKTQFIIALAAIKRLPTKSNKTISIENPSQLYYFLINHS